MIKIAFEEIKGLEFEVVVSEDDGTETAHQVGLDEEFAKQSRMKPEELVKKSFEFLLEREPKESILPAFTIPNTISKYFPEFKSEIVESSQKEKA
ncbi:MAG: hypothetical protein Q8L46_00255 [candidate division WWE3 bacterium]|nr:hypothetical protein [candidate division WWE3 bacterium]